MFRADAAEETHEFVIWGANSLQPMMKEAYDEQHIVSRPRA